MSSIPLPKRLSPIPAAAALLVYGAVILAVGIPCPFHAFTGMYCPGCGGTRAVKALLHGRIGDAIHDNAWLVLVAGPALAIYAVSRIDRLAQLDRAARLLLHVAAWSGVVFFLARNVPVLPFTLLRPLP